MKNRISYLAELYVDGVLSPDEIAELVEQLETEEHRKEFAEVMRFKGLVSCIEDDEIDCWNLARKVMATK